MNSATLNRVPNLDTAATFSPQQIVDLTCALSREIDDLKHQLDWFKRQIFGQKSERRIVEGATGQMSLGEAIDLEQTTPPPSPAERSVVAHKRRSAATKPDAGDDIVPFFDETREKTRGSWPVGRHPEWLVRPLLPQVEPVRGRAGRRARTEGHWRRHYEPWQGAAR